MSPDGTIVAIEHLEAVPRRPTRQSLRARAANAKRHRSGRGRRGWRWALDDVDVQVEPGEAVGLVGINGSGKSTLLKILTRVMYPYAGRRRGRRPRRRADRGAGRHPPRAHRPREHLPVRHAARAAAPEVASRFDEIVEFAELEDAIDRQVKFYSSGMQMRLGFAVAAFLEPDVLLVDEVLAVGDAAFQQRCLDRMRAMLSAGTTLVFVSHDLAAVESITERAVWLHGGRVHEDGPVRDVLGSYRAGARARVGAHRRHRRRRAPGQGQGGRRRRASSCRPNSPPTSCSSSAAPNRRRARLCIGCSEGPAAPIFLLRHDLHLPDDREVEVRCRIDRLPLPRGRYYLWVGVFLARGELLGWQPGAYFDVAGPDLDVGPPGIGRLSPVHVAASWEVGQR